MTRALGFAPWLLMGLLAAAPPAAAASRVVVWLPRDAAALEPEVQRTFAWPGSLGVLGPDSVARRFPPSEASRARAEDEHRLETLLRAAESAFVALQLEQASQELRRCDEVFARLSPSARREAAFLRLSLLEGRVALARGDGRASQEAFAKAAQAAVEVALDEAEYPPEVRQAFGAARAQVRSRAARTLEVASEPSGAEVEVNGQLAGRTPATVQLPPGRCFLSVSRAGRKPHLAACPETAGVAIALEEATRDGLRDQLRERLGADPAWFLEPLLLSSLAVEEDARWIVVLDRDRGGGLKALLYSAAEKALKPLEPARFVETEMAKLSEAVRVQVQAAQRLEAQVVETATGVPAIEARAADPDLGAAAAFVRRRGELRFDRLDLERIAAGRFRAQLPLSLSAEGSWDVDFHAEAYDASGSVACRAGDAAAPLRFRRAAPVSAVVPPSWYSRWYVWTAVGAVAAGAAATGVYFATRPGDVAVTFGGRP